MTLTLQIPYRCPECHSTAVVKTDLAKMPHDLAQRFIDDAALTIETECVECVSKQATRLIDLGELRPNEERVIHMTCGTLHGPEQRCPLVGTLN